MIFECDFCGKRVAIDEFEFAKWNQDRCVYCDSCQEKDEKNICQTMCFCY